MGSRHSCPVSLRAGGPRAARSLSPSRPQPFPGTGPYPSSLPATTLVSTARTHDAFLTFFLSPRRRSARGWALATTVPSPRW